MRRAIAATASQRNIQRSLQPSATLSALQAKEDLKNHAPVGREEPEYDIPAGWDPGSSGAHVAHGRPSRRLFGTTLAESWTNPVVEDIEDGQSFTVMSSAPHMEYLLRDIPRHSIPKRTPGPMSWWSFRDGGAFISHWSIAFAATHPGTMKSDFVMQALAHGLENKIETNLLSGLQRSFRPVDIFFSK
jgi:hypothetical protein